MPAHDTGKHDNYAKEFHASRYSLPVDTIMSALLTSARTQIDDRQGRQRKPRRTC